MTLPRSQCVRRFIKEKHNEYVTLYECINRMYFSLNLNILPHPRAETMKRLIKKYTLLPRDLIHVATAIENGCDYLLTLDDDFKQIDELKSSLLIKIDGLSQRF